MFPVALYNRKIFFFIVFDFGTSHVAPRHFTTMSHTDLLRTSVTLPCGAVIPNRFTKAPLEEVLSTFGGGMPNDDLFRLYRAWADGEWGMIITGNISVDRRYIGLFFDVVMPNEGNEKQEAQYLAQFIKYARAVKGFDVDDTRADAAPPDGRRPLAIAQLVHCGRQSMRGAYRWPWVPAVAPSAVPVHVADGFQSWVNTLFFGTPHALTVPEIHHIIRQFVRAAVFMEKAGFDGVELHGAHGYLLSSFLNPRTNLRTDEYGGTPENRFRIIREIIEQIRAHVSPSFAVGIKLNASDYCQGGQTEDDALQNVQWLAEMRAVDFVEVSGGSYESPAFAERASERTRKREGFFAGFAQRAHSILPEGSTMRIIVTGGFVSRMGIHDAVHTGVADAVGMGRPACVDAALPRKLMDPSVPDAAATVDVWTPPPPPALLPKVALAGFGWATMWYSAQMHLTAHGQPTTPDVSMLSFLHHLHWRK